MALKVGSTPRSEAAEFETILAVVPWGELAFLDLEARAEREAVIFPDRRLTYRAFADEVVHHARCLIAQGIRPGEHVGLLLSNRIEYLVMISAIACVGGVAVTINSRYQASELAMVIEDSDIVLLITEAQVSDDVDYLERLSRAFPELGGTARPDALALAGAPKLRRILLLNGEAPHSLCFAAFVAGGETVPAAEVARRRKLVRIRDPFMMMYTSGTTSSPKGCLLTHESVVRTIQGVATRFALEPDDRYWTPLPMFHMGSINPFGAVLWTGATFVCLPYFDAGEALAMIEAERATIGFLSFPPIIAGLARHPDVKTRDLSSLRALMSNAAVQTPEVKRELLEAFPDVVHTGMYGMTEGGGAVCCTAVYDSPGAGTRRNGRPMPGMQVRIVRPDGTDADPDEPGEIWFAGYGLFEGYYKQPEKTAEVFIKGWMHSGDRGSMNEAGEILFMGRSKDMLKVGGENVSPGEIEAFLEGHPAVKVCQVIGIADERLTEVAVAVIELRPGQTATDAELIAYCRGNIASFKVPRQVRFVEDWPFTPSMKIKKSELASLFAD